MKTCSQFQKFKTDILAVDQRCSVHMIKRKKLVQGFCKRGKA